MSVFSKWGTPQISSNIFREMMDFVQETTNVTPPALWGFAYGQESCSWGAWDVKSVDTDLWVIRLTEALLHQLIGSLSHYLQGISHPSWCRISSINCTYVWVQSYGWIHVSTTRLMKSFDLPNTDDSDLRNLSPVGMYETMEKRMWQLGCSFLFDWCNRFKPSAMSLCLRKLFAFYICSALLTFFQCFLTKMLRLYRTCWISFFLLFLYFRWFNMFIHVWMQQSSQS